MSTDSNPQPSLLVRQCLQRPGLYTAPSQLETGDLPLPHTHTVRKAFERLGLDGVWYLDHVPTVYFKSVARFEQENARRDQSYLWNQQIVPLLVISSETEVKVYSAQALPAAENEDVDNEERLVKVLEGTIDILEIDELFRSIETGEIFRKGASFKREHGVDRCLLENLTLTANKLSISPGGLRVEFVHLLLIRLLFTCYLIERGMIKGDDFAEHPVLKHLGQEYKRLNDIIAAGTPAAGRRILFDVLFPYIKKHFNGSLLASDLSTEKSLVTDDHMRIVRSFLNGDDMRSGQSTLGFWAYDFSVIPIETISAMYQGFLSEQGEVQETSGAYYTPPHLAELALDVLVDGYHGPLYEARVLDPACGSGVFLVSMFNRMANQWITRYGSARRKTRAKELLAILREQIFGVDINETACHITCFSLYLAVLDHLEPWDVQELQRQGLTLPSLLHLGSDGGGAQEDKTIICNSFFDPQLALPRGTFDLVIGNPPWISRANVKDTYFLGWVRGRHAKLAPQKQIAHGFMWEVQTRLKESGVACLLLPSAVLFNATDKFQDSWFRSVTAERVINLSDLRFILFADAVHPGVVIRFRNVKPDIRQASFLYESPKADIRTQRDGVVCVRAEDARTIRLADLLSKARSEEAAILWKINFWGTWRDSVFLQRLTDMPKLADLFHVSGDSARWRTGVGIKVAGDQNPIWWERERLFLDSDSPNIQMLVLPRDCKPVGDRFGTCVDRPRDPDLFVPPLIVFNKGGSKIAFLDFPVLFRDSLFSISGAKGDEKLLRFLVAVMRSSVAKYFYFHTVANYGIARTQFFTDEILRLPFFLPEKAPAPQVARTVLEEVDAKIESLKIALESVDEDSLRAEMIAKVQSECEPLIRRYYDVDECEEILISDTVKYVIPSATPASNPREQIATLRRVGENEQEAYLEILCRTLHLYAKEGKRIEAHAFNARNLSIVTLSRAKGESKRPVVKSGKAISDVLKRVEKHLSLRYGGFVYRRNLKIFAGDCVYIIKPMSFRSWMPSTALNDADDIASAVLRKGAT